MHIPRRLQPVLDRLQSALDRLRPGLDWLRTLGQNLYFWGGIGGVLLLGLLAYVLIDAVIMPSYTRHGVSVQVPNVEGQPFEKATKLVENRNLQVQREVGRYNPRVDLGTVVDQNPPPKADVKPGRRVYLTVNAGEVPMVSLPDLNGISVREAKNRVSSLGLVVDTVKADSIPSPYPNTVTRQNPAPGDSLEQGSEVVLWHSTGLGADTVRVPSVVGRSVEEAKRRLLRHDLRSIVVEPLGTEAEETTSSGAASPGMRRFVRRQGRAPETRVRAGTEIRLFVTDDSTSVPSPTTERPETSGVENLQSN